MEGIETPLSPREDPHPEFPSDVATDQGRDSWQADVWYAGAHAGVYTTRVTYIGKQILSRSNFASVLVTVKQLLINFGTPCILWNDVKHLPVSNAHLKLTP